MGFAASGADVTTMGICSLLCFCFGLKLFTNRITLTPKSVVESHLFNMTSTGRGQDFLRTPNQMIEKLSHLADVVSLADFRPTDQALEVTAQLTKQLGEHRNQMKQIVETDVPAFNRTVRDRGMTGGVMVPVLR